MAIDCLYGDMLGDTYSNILQIYRHMLTHNTYTYSETHTNTYTHTYMGIFLVNNFFTPHPPSKLYKSPNCREIYKVFVWHTQGAEQIFGAKC